MDNLATEFKKTPSESEDQHEFTNASDKSWKQSKAQI
jgi:hypothetical protein